MDKSKPKRVGLIIGGAIVLIVLLAGAAFVGGRLITQSATGTNLVPGGSSTGNGKPQVNIEVVPAAELPNTSPDIIGPFVSRQDNSVFVATASKFMVVTNADGSVSTQGMDSGQRLEVVVTSDTQIYRDVTEQHAPRVPPADGKMQQVVESGTIDALGNNSIVSAWGDRRGDRLIARVLVYTPAFIMNASNNQ